MARLTYANVKASFRGSLFWMPLLFLIGGLALALALSAVEGSWTDDPTLLPDVSTRRAASVLGVIATSTITVVGLVASVMVIAVQLSSSQFSPRVLRRFLRDRVDQVAIGVVAGTFAYSLTVLVLLPDAPDESAALVTVTAMVLAGGSLLAILVFIDHTARTMRAGDVVVEITRETRAVIAKVYDEVPPPGFTVVDTPDTPGDPTVTIRAASEGWVQSIDISAIAHAVPNGSVALIEVPIGKFAIEDTALVSVWAGDGVDDEAADRVRLAFDLGDQREMAQDVAFGIRQLVDIALRGLSPAINDPGTAYEVINNLGAVLADLLQRDLTPEAVEHEDGAVILRPGGRDFDRYVHLAFEQLRVVAAPHPAVVVAMLHTLRRVAEVGRTTGRTERLGAVRRAGTLIVQNALLTEHVDGDVARIREAAAALDVQC